MPSIPAQIADITTDWLNEVLPSNVGRVKGFEVTRFGTGVGILGELARLTLDYVDGRGSGPATIVAKCQSPAPENQFLAQAMGFYLRDRWQATRNLTLTLGLRYELYPMMSRKNRGIEVLDMNDVKSAKVGHLLATLRDSGRQHAMVVDRDAKGEERVRGLFSLTQIARQLGQALCAVGRIQRLEQLLPLQIGRAHV